MPRQSGTRPRARHCAREGFEAARPGPPFFAANARIAIHGNVSFGSKADISACVRNVRFTPESGHSAGTEKCPLSAISGHLGDQTNHGRLRR